MTGKGSIEGGRDMKGPEAGNATGGDAVDTPRLLAVPGKRSLKPSDLDSPSPAAVTRECLRRAWDAYYRRPERFADIPILAPRDGDEYDARILEALRRVLETDRASCTASSAAGSDAPQDVEVSDG